MTADRTFLNWLADRLVHQYGEKPGMDFVLKTRNIAASLPPERETPNMSRPENTGSDALVPIDLLLWASVLLDGYDLTGTGSGPSEREQAEHDANVARLRALLA